MNQTIPWENNEGNERTEECEARRGGGEHRWKTIRGTRQASHGLHHTQIGVSSEDAKNKGFPIDIYTLILISCYDSVSNFFSFLGVFC
jgi:hypothetical protein